jgi:hypothetical protein
MARQTHGGMAGLAGAEGGVSQRGKGEIDLACSLSVVRVSSVWPLGRMVGRTGRGEATGVQHGPAVDW